MYTPPHAYNTGAKAYATVARESGAMSASPHQLITMLFDGAKTAITMARHHMANNEISAKGSAISKAINIVDNGLKASLDEAERLLDNISSAWIEVNPRKPQSEAPRAPATNQLSTGS